MAEIFWKTNGRKSIQNTTIGRKVFKSNRRQVFKRLFEKKYLGLTEKSIW